MTAPLVKLGPGGSFTRTTCLSEKGKNVTAHTAQQNDQRRQNALPAIPLRITLPATEPIGQAAWHAVNQCPKRREPAVHGIDGTRHVTVPAEDVVDVDLTDAILTELLCEAEKWRGDKTEANMLRMVVLDSLGNEIPGAHIVSRYALESTD